MKRGLYEINEVVYIYEIVAVTHDGYFLRYIGSTSDIELRMNLHVSDYRSWVNEKACNYCSSSQVMEHDWKYNILETMTNVTTEDAKRREGEYQKMMECVNINRAGRTPREFYQDNRRRRLDQQLKLKKRRVNCENCGVEMCHGSLNRHFKNKHKII